MAINESLIREAIVREIRDAQRWSAIEEGWQALLHVKQMAKALHEEYDLIHLPTAYGSGAGPSEAREKERPTDD